MNQLLGKMKNLIRSESDGESFNKAKDRAISWIKNAVIKDGGLPSADAPHIPYQEVTGYTIPTLLMLNEKRLARRLASWLISVQRQDGSFSAPDGKPYTFDTGQALRGLMSVMDEMPDVENNIIKSCEWIMRQTEPDGKVTTPAKDLWHLPGGRQIPESIHLYVLPPLRDAGEKLGRPEYIKAVQNSTSYYKKNHSLEKFDTLSHFFGYIMEALYDLGETELVRAGMKNIKILQKRDGSIPAYPDVKWICSTGMAQLAVVWLKMGIEGPAVKAMRYLCKLQNESGGFFGSYGKGANYFQRHEISWGVKYFLDAYILFQNKKTLKA